MNSHLRVTLVQPEIAWQEPARNRRMLAGHFRGLFGHTDLIVLPEMFTTGFSMDAPALAEEMDGPTVGWLREEAVSLACAITGSLIVREDGRYYNRLVWASPDGTILHYDKRHLFRMAAEHEHYSAGSRRLIVEYKGWRICPLVCYDLRFPVWSRSRDDTDLLVYVANWPAPRRDAWRALLPARAIENLCYCVGVNRVGTDGREVAYAGDSVALDYLGQPLFVETDEPFVRTVALSRDALDRHRESFPAHMDADDFDIRFARDPDER